MRRFPSVMLVMVLVSLYGVSLAQQASAPPIVNASGTTISTAVVINDRDAHAAIKAEDAWLLQHYPDCLKVGQALRNKDGHFYDAIDIVTTSRTHEIVYFDVTKPFTALAN